MQVCPENSAGDLFRGLEKMMVIVPIDANVNETEYNSSRDEVAVGSMPQGSTPCGTFNSSTMIVMMMARTPSLNASSRVVFILP